MPKTAPLRVAQQHTANQKHASQKAFEEAMVKEPVKIQTKAQQHCRIDPQNQPSPTPWRHDRRPVGRIRIT